MRVNPCMKSNYSNLNDLSSESTTGSEATFTCQTTESSNINLEKDSIIKFKMFKDKSNRYDVLKKHETTTFEKTNEVVDLKNCNLIDTEKKKTTTSKLCLYY